MVSRVVVGFALKHKPFNKAIIPCTTTLYQWIDRGIMKTTNLDLLEKLSRKIKKQERKPRLNKRVLGKSIDDRPEEVETPKTFGHWEIDTVVGSRIKSDAVLLTLVERQTHFEVILKLNGKDAHSVDQAVHLMRERAGENFSHCFNRDFRQWL